MILSDSLSKNNILLKTKSKNRWDLIEEMVDLVEKNNKVNSTNKDIIIKALKDREKSMSTGIGNGVAIPHCSILNVSEITIALVINQKGIDFDAIDNLPVKIIILLIVPKNKLTQHIKTLANIAKMMSSEEIRNKLLSSKSIDGIIKIIKNYDKQKK